MTRGGILLYNAAPRRIAAKKFDKLRMTRAAQSKPEGQPHTRLDLVGRKCYIIPIRDAEDVVPYNVRRNIFCRDRRPRLSVWMQMLLYKDIGRLSVLKISDKR